MLPMNDPANAESPAALPGEPSASAADTQPINILLVDDEAKNLVVLQTILDDPAYRLVGANSANDALLALVQMEFALIVLDIQMPDMNGIELAHMIKQRKRTASIPIIFLTAHFSEDQHVLEGYETGAVDYLMKPVNSVILRSKVAVFAELHRKNRDSFLAQQALSVEVRERRQVQEQLRQLNLELERRVEERTQELLKANSALSQSEERLRRSQQAGQTGTWEWDLKSGMGTWSESARQLFDLDTWPAEIGLETWISRVHPDDRERVRQRLQEVTRSGPYRDEFRVGYGMTGVKWVELIGAVEHDGNDARRMRGAVRNVTDRKKMELELKDADRRKDQFLAMLGHELRNPLAPIRNAVSIIAHVGATNPDLQWCHEVLDRQVTHLTRLVDDLLDVSRVSRGKIQLQIERVDLGLAVQAAVESSLPLINSRNHELRLTLSETPIFVEGDAVRLSQIVANLLNNAAKYTDDGGTIRVSLERSSSHPDMAVIAVADNGRGINPDSIESLFELFYQADRNLDRSDGGLGIGLSLVRSLVEMHQGKIGVQSAGPGQGSVFQVHLPCLALPTPVSQPEPTKLSNVTGSNRKLLIVDDNRDSARSLGMLLKSMGFEVLLAYDGREGVEVALRERPEIILLDIGLPQLNGYEACREIRIQGLTNQLVVAVTGYGLDDDRKLSQDAGFDHHLVKPVDITELIRLLSLRSPTLTNCG